MDLFMTLVMGTAMALVGILQLCMLLRALLPLFMMREDHPVLLFCAMVTDIRRFFRNSILRKISLS